MSRAAAWTFAAAALSAVGLIHAYDLTGNDLYNRFIFTTVDGQLVTLAAPWFAIMYALGGVILLVMGRQTRSPTGRG